MKIKTTTLTFALLLTVPTIGCKSGNPQPPPAEPAATEHAAAEHEEGCGNPDHDCAGHEEEAAADESVATAFDAAPAVGSKARCPVSKKVFTVSEATVSSEHEGKHYAFCCPGCKEKFDAAPADFAAK